MKLLLLVLNITLVFPVILVAQKTDAIDTTKSFYRNLPILKHYAISASSITSADTSWFKINDGNVDEKTYKKYTQFIDNIDKCKPCILLGFDTSENLILKRVSYGDCTVGYWIEYYPSGKVKVIGHFKENKSGVWENLFDRGYCRQDGLWTYYNSKGAVIYSEIWKEGKLLKKTLKKMK